MRWDILPRVAYNSFDYFEKTLITENGFREYDVRWVVGKEINSNGFFVLGRAYGTMAQEVMDEKRVVLGHDFRAYSQELARSLALGLMSTGMHVIDIGLALTPMVYFAQHHFKARAAMQVTASHNENGWSGIKIANGLSSTLGPEGILRFKKYVQEGRFLSGAGTYESFDDIGDLYREDAISAGKLKNPLRVVLAAGNGTAGRFVPQVLRDMGCEVIELDCGPDWEFKKHNPNPEDMSFLHAMSSTVVEHKAAIGIGIDGDGDRIGVVDDKGREIFSDKLGLLLARWICPRNPGRSVVIDVKGTGLFDTDPILKESGSKVVMWKTGHSYIKAKVREVDAVAGFEKSGHWFFNAPYGRGYDDAVISTVHLLRMLDDVGQSLSQLVEALPLSHQSPTLGAFCPDDQKYGVVDDVTASYKNDKESGVKIAGKKIVDLITVNGVRFVLEDGSWGLVRASSNKPSLVIVAESCASDDLMRDIIEHIQTRLAATGKVGEYDQELPPRQGK
jgi:phosphomannomutase/phosphoglucomutase